MQKDKKIRPLDKSGWHFENLETFIKLLID